MARALSRREIYLVAGLGLAAVLWIAKSWNAAPEEPQATAGKKGATRAAAAMGPKAPVVHIDQLDKSVVKYDARGRDLFKYSQRPPSMAEVSEMKRQMALAKKAQEEAEARAREQAERDRLAAEAQARELALHPPPPPEPVPPAITFQFLGYVGPADDRIAAFEEGNQTFVAKTGEIVKKDFRIQEIRYESVVIAYVDPRFKGKSRELALTRGR